MIDLLLINPHESAYNTLLPIFKSQDLICKSIVTPDYLHEAKWVTDEDHVFLEDITMVTTALGFGLNGQSLVETLNSTGKIVLGNLSWSDLVQKRLQHYLNFSNTKINNETWLFETVSFKGRHVLCYSKFYNHEWKFIGRSEQNLPFFSDKIEEVFEYLDVMGISNGPAQVYIDSESKFQINLDMWANNLDKINLNQLQKHFIHIWPKVLAQGKKNTKLAISTFYRWVDQFGSSKRFSLTS